MKILDIIQESESSGKIVIVGDSIAVGIASSFPNAVVDAKVGRSTTAILSAVSNNKEVQGADVAIISAGTNDYPIANGGKNNNPQATISNIQSIKNALKAKKYIWIVPFNKSAAKDVESAIGGDTKVELGSVASPDKEGLHPTNYDSVIQAIKSDIGTVAKAPNVAGQRAEPLTTIDVPQGTKGPAIADMQKLLVALGYSLPKYGVDGIIGPETRGALAQFQKSEQLKDNGKPTPETIAVMNKLLADHPEFSTKITKSTAADVKTRDYSQGASQYAEFATDANGEKAKTICEKFLGKEISDNEWNYLLRAIYAESTSNQNELAHVAAVILNRARNSSTNIISVLRAPNQFQSVTGTRYDPNPSPNFTQGPSANSLGNIYKGLIDNLPSAPKDIMNFTAANREAYGKGTNVGFLDKLVASGGKQIGGTVFGTVTA